MLSRALSLATAMLLIGFAAPSSLIAPASAQNLEAGKSPAQLFNGNCGVCHKSARGLLKSVPPGQLPGFLRQHYTTSSDMARAMSAYVIANGTGGGGGGRRGNDDGLTRQGRELSREQAPAPTEAAPGDRRLRPSAAERQQLQPGPDGAPAAEQPPRRSRTKRQPPAEATPAGEAQTPAAETERPAGQKQKTGKKNRRHQEEPKADTVKDEPAKSETPKEAAPAKPAEESKPAEAAKPEPKPEAPAATRSDPVPAVTPAPKEPESTAPASPPPAAAPEPTKPAE